MSHRNSPARDAARDDDIVVDLHRTAIAAVFAAPYGSKLVLEWQDDDDEDITAWCRWTGVIEHHLSATEVAIRWAAGQPRRAKAAGLAAFPVDGYVYRLVKVTPPRERLVTTPPPERRRERGGEDEAPPIVRLPPAAAAAAAATAAAAGIPPPPMLLQGVAAGLAPPPPQLGTPLTLESMLYPHQQQQQATATQTMQLVQQMASQFTQSQQVVTDKVLNRTTGRTMRELCEGLRVPTTADAMWVALYPYFFWTEQLGPEEIAKWRTKLTDLLQHLTVQFKSPPLRDRYELARDTLLTLAAKSTFLADLRDDRVFARCHCRRNSFEGDD